MNSIARREAGGSLELVFNFEQRHLRARPGQSIAAALHADGVRTLSRSTKFHRPRGFHCGFGACGNCLVTVDGSPGTPACATLVRGGDTVVREQGWPNTEVDIFRTADLLRARIGAGFQFTLFRQHPRLSKIAGSILGRLAGGGRIPTPAGAAQFTARRVTRHREEFVVVGAGVSGLAAALAIATAGRRVMLIDTRANLQRSRVRRAEIRTAQGARKPKDLLAELTEKAKTQPAIELVSGTVVGIFDRTLVVAQPDSADGPRRMEIEVQNLVLANGSYELPPLVAGADLPGSMLADAAVKLAEVDGVQPGRRAVLVGDREQTRAVAQRLRAAGVAVVAQAPLAQVFSVRGWSKVRGVLLSPDPEERRARGLRARCQRRISADLVVFALGRRAADELQLQVANVAANADAPRTLVVGTAAGSETYSLEEIEGEVRQLVENSALSTAS